MMQNKKLFLITQHEPYITNEMILEGVNHSRVRDWAYILHDKDEGTERHWHVAIRTKDTCSFDSVAKWFGVLPNYVEGAKARWVDMLKYLTHQNAPEKHQYPDDEVASNFDFVGEKAKGDKLGATMKGIEDGTIKWHNISMYVAVDEFVKWRRQIESAFKYRAEMMKAKGDRQMDVVFITGPAGSGKTTYAKQIAQGRGLEFFISSGSNDVFDSYAGQPCIILDDLRPSDRKLSDLLKALDNHTASTVSSRFYNRVLECELMIVTTVRDIDTFYRQTFENEPECGNQLKRRCKTYIQMEMNSFRTSLWNDQRKMYELMVDIDFNPVLKDLEKMLSKMTEDGKREYIAKVLGQAGQGIMNIAKEIGKKEEKPEWKEVKEQEKLPF